MSFPRIGVIGAGQLARMMAPAAESLGVKMSLLAADAGECATEVYSDVMIGDYRDPATLRAFAERVDVVTFDHEHVPPEQIQALRDAGVSIHPGPEALIHAQNKITMRRAVDHMGLPNPRWADVSSPAELEAFAEETGWPVVVKTPTGGYDGKGVRVVSGAAEVADWFEHGPLLAEEKVDFTRELAVMVARSPMGQTAVWPVVATWQQDGVCKEAVAPAPGLSPELARTITADVLIAAATFDVTGVMAMEMFEVRDPATGEPRYLVNEFAMRPHNTGHWSQDGSVTSQFEQHLRAILDLPLGDPSAQFPVSVMVNVLGGDYPDLYAAYRHVMAHDPEVKVHLYGKEVRPGRKVGHVNLVGDDEADVLERARHAADYIAGIVTR